jgi:hypothetical protein
MAALFLEGFDKYGPVNSNGVGVQTLLQSGDWTAATNNWSIVAGLSVTGQAIQASMNAANMLVRPLGANYPRLIGGCRFASNLAGTFNAGIIFVDGGVANQCSITVNTTGTISLRNGAPSGAAIATSAGSIVTNSTHYLEWDITFSNTGAYQVWLDGVSLFSGIGDTTGGVANTANTLVLSGLSGGSMVMTFDDLYLFDTTGTTNNAVLLTSPRVETTFPTSDSAVQFAFGAGILGSNAQRVTATNAPAAGSLVLRRFTPSVNCTLASISIMPGATSGTANYRGVAYSDTAGAAGTLLSSGTQVTGVTSGTTATLPLTTPQALTAGTPYWIGFINDTSVVLQETDAGNLGYRAANTYASGAPGTAPAMTAGQASYLLWGNLTGITGNWYESAQQPPPGTLSYVFDATVNHEDLYSFGALSVTPTNVYAVAVKGFLQRSDSGAKTASLRTKSGASDGGGSLAGQTPPTTFGWVGSMFETDPQTGVAWTGSGLNAAQSGVRVDS